MMLYTIYESSGLCSFRPEDYLKIAIWTFLWPRDLLMQLTETIWTTLVGDHPGIIPVKFGQNPMSGFREEVVWLIKLTHSRTDVQSTKDCHKSSL